MTRMQCNVNKKVAMFRSMALAPFAPAKPLSHGRTLVSVRADRSLPTRPHIYRRHLKGLAAQQGPLSPAQPWIPSLHGLTCTLRHLQEASDRHQGREHAQLQQHGHSTSNSDSKPPGSSSAQNGTAEKPEEVDEPRRQRLRQVRPKNFPCVYKCRPMRQMHMSPIWVLFAACLPWCPVAADSTIYSQRGQAMCMSVEEMG